MKTQKIALFHPWIKSRGGAEKVVLELLEKSKHEIDIYTWVYDKENTFSEFKKYKINVLVPRFGKKISRLYFLRALFLPMSFFKKIPLEKYDKFLISTSGVAEFITFRNYKKGKTYAYVHTPLRDANKKIVNWNLKNRYTNFPKKQLYLFAVKIYRIFEKQAWKNLDILIFNSELSKSRAVEHNLLKEKQSYVIYPPINISKSKKQRPNSNKNFVYISRLNHPKRQDLLLEAWKSFSQKNPEYNLILVGTPDNKNYYKKLILLSKGMKSVKIKEKISNKYLEKIISNSLAGIFLGYQEDFGMVPLEIICSGKPLLAVDEGGYANLIENHTLFHKIKEKHNSKEMVKEIEKELELFIKKDYSRVKPEKIKLNNFIKEIEGVLGR